MTNENDLIDFDAAPDEDIPEKIEEIQTEAKKTFSLRRRIQKGVSGRTDRVSIPLDIEAVKAVRAARVAVQEPRMMIAFWEEQIENGQVEEGKYDEALAQKKPELEKLEAELDAAVALMNESVLSVHLQAIPRVKLKDIRRKVKAEMAPKGKIADKDMEKFTDRVMFSALKLMITDIKDSSGASAEREEDGAFDVAALQDELVESDYDRLTKAANELIFIDQVGLAGTDDPGF